MSEEIEKQEAQRCLNELWYPVINDLIGGYAVTNQAGCMYVSEIDNKLGSGRIIADCFSREHAEHIAIVHNDALEEKSIGRQYADMAKERAEAAYEDEVGK